MRAGTDAIDYKTAALALWAIVEDALIAKPFWERSSR
jgi:hypothetical protein